MKLFLSLVIAVTSISIFSINDAEAQASAQLRLPA